MSKKIVICLLAVLLVMPVSFFALEVGAVELSSLIKSSESTLYYYSADGKRYVFPNEKTYLSWYDDFSSITELTHEELAEISLAGNVTYRPGKKMIKIQTDPKVYAVAQSGILRWVKTEAIAESLYGADWNTKIDDVPDVFFMNYSIGDPIESDSDYDPNTELSNNLTVDNDKGIEVPTEEPEVEEPIEEETPAEVANWDNFRLTELDTRQRYPNIMAQESNYLAMWSDNLSEQDEIHTAILENNVLDSKVVASEGIYESTLADGAWNGTGSILVWEDAHPDRRDINYIKMNAGGYRVFKEKSLTGQATSTNKIGSSKSPQITWNGERFGVVWYDTRNDTAQSYSRGYLYYQKIDASGQLIGNNTQITTSFSDEFFPDIVWGNDEYGITWEDNRDGQYDIYFARIDTEGNVAEDSEIKITETSATSTKPVVSWNGSSYGIVWQEEVENVGSTGNHTEIFYQKVGSNGEKIGTAIRLTTKDSGDSERPRIAMDNAKYGITWTDYRGYSAKNSSNIYFMEINSDGAITVAEENVSNFESLSFDPNISVLDATYRIIYTDNRDGDYELYTATRQ